MRKLLFSLLALAALCGNVLAQSVVLPGFPPGVFQDRGAIDGAPSGCSKATTANAAYDGSQNAAAVTTLLCGWVAAGIPTDALYLLTINSTANSLINAWIPGTFNLTAVTAGTFTGNQGLAGGGGAYYDSHFNPTTAVSPNCTQNSCSFGICLLNSRTSSILAVVQVGSANLTQTNGLYVISALDPGNWGADINQNAIPATLGAASNVQGSWIATRTGASLVTGYAQGASSGTNTTTSASPVNSDVFLMANDNSGTAANASSDTFGYFFIGGGLTGTQAAAAYSLLNTYMNSVYTGGSNPC